MKKTPLIALIVCILGIVIFVYGSTTGTIVGYQGADGLYYSSPDAVGSNEWMCTPAFILAAVGGFVYWLTKDL